MVAVVVFAGVVAFVVVVALAVELVAADSVQVMIQHFDAIRRSAFDVIFRKKDIF